MQVSNFTMGAAAWVMTGDAVYRVRARSHMQLFLAAPQKRRLFLLSFYDNGPTAERGTASFVETPFRRLQIFLGESSKEAVPLLRFLRCCKFSCTSMQT